MIRIVSREFDQSRRTARRQGDLVVRQFADGLQCRVGRVVGLVGQADHDLQQSVIRPAGLDLSTGDTSFDSARVNSKCGGCFRHRHPFVGHDRFLHEP
jgi:hypothetical protein